MCLPNRPEGIKFVHKFASRHPKELFTFTFLWRFRDIFVVFVKSFETRKVFLEATIDLEIAGDADMRVN